MSAVIFESLVLIEILFPKQSAETMYGCLNLKTIYFISIICNQTSPSGNKGQVPVTDSDIV